MIIGYGAVPKGCSHDSFPNIDKAWYAFIPSITSISPGASYFLKHFSRATELAPGLLSGIGKAVYVLLRELPMLDQFLHPLSLFHRRNHAI